MPETARRFSSPKVVVGIPLYNHAKHLREALESLLGQTYRNVAFCMADDLSDDGTSEIVKEYMAFDDRIRYVRNDSRLGMILNWRKTFEMGRELFPGAEFFAWGSDHDVWHPRWLAAMMEAMEKNPGAGMAYPLNIRIGDDGEVLRTVPWTFDTAGSANRFTRFFKTCTGMSAGNMVYGLFRRDLLAKAGVYRPLLIPDRLLFAELSLYAEFVQVPEILWYRRYVGLVTMARQRRSFFPDDRPFYSYLPWWINHIAALFWNLAIRGTGRPEVGAIRGAAFTGFYAAITLVQEFVRPFRFVWKQSRIFLLRPVKRFVVRHRLIERVRNRAARLMSLILRRGLPAAS
jgi:glycosyltransferase involved in cell wall biosynthesis